MHEAAVRRHPIVGSALLLLALVVPLVPTAAGAVPPERALVVEVLSSAPDQVTDGDALVRVAVPRQVPAGQVTVLAGGRDVTDAFEPSADGRSLVGVVTGLPLGPTEIVANANGNGRGRPEPGARDRRQPPSQRSDLLGAAPAAVRVHDGAGHLRRASAARPAHGRQPGPLRYPRRREGPDGSYPRDGRGYPTGEATIVGWSKDCATPTRIDYIYKYDRRQLPVARRPDDPSRGCRRPRRPSTGRPCPTSSAGSGARSTASSTASRCSHPSAESGRGRDDSLWNGRLVFSLQGGVAIGHHQGTLSAGAMLFEPVLGQGYAVVNSTGLRTNTHYNLQLGGETALMLKEHFIEDHGVPLYTVGVGGSGGAIQQYVYGQNHPGLLDAAIPQYSYPDMVTQTIHVGDCELLEHYFDVTDRDNPRWQDPESRQAVLGLNATNFPKNLSAGEIAQWNQLYAVYGLLGYQVMDRDPASPAPALTECRRAWFGLTPLVMNPTFTNVSDLDKLAQGTDGVEWTHWADLVNIYGTDDDGFARVPWDNVGVQYGLEALTSGAITPAEFLDLNAQVGSWKDSSEMVTEGFPFVGRLLARSFDPWSSRQMNLSPDGGVDAGAAARGRPRRDARRVHLGHGVRRRHRHPDHRLAALPRGRARHAPQPPVVRARASASSTSDGDADNQVIWFTDARPAVAFDQTPMAFEVIDEWMANIQAHPEQTVAENRPAAAVDSCFDTDGALIASGDDVWDGVLDDEPAGACTQRFAIYSSSRRVAGGPFRGGVFKCALQPVDRGRDRRALRLVGPHRRGQDRLEAIFPQGVCDFSRPDAGRPG